MRCAWDSLLSVLPLRLREQVDRLGREDMQELRLRVSQPVELVRHRGSQLLEIKAAPEDIRFVINTASQYSPWAATTVSKGYITAPGGHRIGICGDCVIKEGAVSGIRSATSLCIRVARDIPNVANGLPIYGSLLILGPPGAGKTTLLRDLIRIRSERGTSVTVVDERGELFASGQGFYPGPKTDILTGCSKAQGIQMALRTMGPGCIAVDEITAAEDCQALLSALWCGVELLATAHAASVSDLQNRTIYRPLWECGVFDKAVVLKRDKSRCVERMGVCT